ncbi:hypothetical protein GB931_16405 [Modestobacter sp. I12A-02628]|uniref:Uncharacterized protein n=1 Tax=Goekera deserti TaxID=2497753 RepID=A0A7K3WGK3_9ACTN|nr:hypothetical protein [Goekera deserti]MPQ99469.1 hypothetical protein [Goekera deserti]NDI48956.1 hypothetical protein [Goekera deserti]NEL55574.1 hypothetical protein [Goekera deserti]
MNPLAQAVLAVSDQDPQDVGTAGPIGLALILVLLVAVFALGRSMTGHLKKLPRTFDPADQPVVVPDTPAELFEPRAPGADLLDHLRRAPLAIEAPRPEDDTDGRPRSAD